MDQQPPCKAGGLKENMMRVQGAVIREQGQTFAVVIVKSHVIQNRSKAAETINSFAPVFGVPVVLMAQDGRGQPTYYGRQDESEFARVILSLASADGWCRFSASRRMGTVPTPQCAAESRVRRQLRPARR
jgi:hypothetical protein